MGVDFASSAMIGRQSFAPDLPTLQRVLRVLGIDRDAAELKCQTYGEDFFTLLGAKSVESVDVSVYEQATILHDMNLAIPVELRERFTLVHDGGSIEHVFNIPQAFKNCMEMVRVGGHFTQVNVANNFSGHGFWQFSPELIFRMFTRDNGFQLEAVLMHEVTPGGAWYVVSDPDQLHRRVELCNDQPTYILTVARRIENVPIFTQSPQQSDYVSMWNATPGSSQTGAVNAVPAPVWTRAIPPFVKRSLRSVVRSVTRPPKKARGFDRPGYRLISEEDLLRGKVDRLNGPAT
jgi:hypothetical protein